MNWTKIFEANIVWASIVTLQEERELRPWLSMHLYILHEIKYIILQLFPAIILDEGM